MFGGLIFVWKAILHAFKTDPPSVRRSWTERTGRSRRSRTLTAPSRRNPRRWSSNWRRRVRDGGAWDFTWRMFTLLLHSALRGLFHRRHDDLQLCSTVQNLLVFVFLPLVPVWHLPSVFVHLLKRFHGKNTFAVMPLWALFCSNQNFDLLIAHQSRLHVCTCAEVRNLNRSRAYVGLSVLPQFRFCCGNLRSSAKAKTSRSLSWRWCWSTVPTPWETSGRRRWGQVEGLGFSANQTKPGGKCQMAGTVLQPPLPHPKKKNK